MKTGVRGLTLSSETMMSPAQAKECEQEARPAIAKRFSTPGGKE